MAAENWGALGQRGGWAILQYSFCYGRNILKIQPCITMSLFMVDFILHLDGSCHT